MGGAEVCIALTGLFYLPYLPRVPTAAPSPP